METPSIRIMDWYYHGIPRSKSGIANILIEGIKCAILKNVIIKIIM